MSNPERPTVREFRDAIVRAFDFLRTDYGFHVAADEYRALGPGFMGEPVVVDEVPEARLGDGIASVRFESSAIAVKVGDDPRMETTCQLYRLGAPRDSVDLWHVRSFVGAAEESRYEWGHATMEGIVTELADWLARYGGPWMRGEPRAWEALLQWWADGMPEARPHL